MKPWTRIAEYAGFHLDDRQLGLLSTYRDWLRSEAIPAGGLGPGESGRLDDRHIADSLLFARPFAHRPYTVVDLGTGVGLPGIPLAVLWPQTVVTLLDRSARRVDLAKRACRVLDLDNVKVTRVDFTRLRERFPAVVSRATLPPERLGPHVKKLLQPGGMAVVGGSWKERPDSSGWDTCEIPAEMLDRTVWLLIMRSQ